MKPSDAHKILGKQAKQAKAPLPKGIKCYFEFVTPALAAAYLKKNTENRPIRRPRVEDFKLILQNGEIEITGQAISFGADGILYDGQHRLTAVVETGIGAYFLVVEGLLKSSRRAIDRGLKRTTSDNIFFSGGPRLTETGSARLSALWTLPYAITHRPASNSEIVACYEKHREAFDAISEIFGNVKRYSISAVAAAFMLAYRENPALVKGMASQYITGEGLTKGSPAMILRNSVERRSGGLTAMEKREIFMQACSMIAAHLDNVPRRRVGTGIDTVVRFMKASDMPLERPEVATP